MEGFLERRLSPILIDRVRRNAPHPFAGLSSPRVSLALRVAQSLNDKPM